MRIRTKLAVALVVPLVALAVLSLAAISASRDKADDASETARVTRQQVDLARAATGPGGLISALQVERNVTSIDLLGLREVLGERPVDEIRGDTDESIVEFRQTIATRSGAVQKAYQPALAVLDEIDGARANVDAYDGERSPEAAGSQGAATFDEYSVIINTIFDVNSTVALGLDDPGLRSGARFIDQISRLNDHQANLIRTIALPLVDPTSPGFVNDPEAFGTAQGTFALMEAIEHDLTTSGTTFYRDLAAKSFADPRNAAYDEATGAALTGAPIDVTTLLSDEATHALDASEAARDEAAQRLGDDAEDLIASAESEADEASDEADLVRNGTVVVMLLAVALTLLAARSITRPLRRLADDAEAMATRRLPEAVQSILDAPLGEDVNAPELPRVSSAGGFEIGELATALNTVQDSAAELAIEQAVLRRNISDSFVNLGRRNQNLLSRQLDSITEMERDETDPDELEKLFTLDHLATRMRRNAESLLLLAGLEPHRQWSAPVALIDIMRGALGEVEDYARVEISRFDDALVNGSAAADLTHLVAELLENALHFSPPGRNVVVAGARRPHGYMLAVVDNGIGMEPDELEQANRRLAGEESFTVAPSRYLGHYVVGIQAQRLKTPVNLQDTPMGGVTALIDITAVLADDAVEAAPVLESASPQPGTPPAAEPAVPTTPALASRPEPVSAPVVEPVASAPARVASVEEVKAPEPAQAASAVAPAQPNGNGAVPPPELQTTASGYKKRVRGSHAPRTEVISAHGDRPDNTPGATDAPSSTAEHMRSMLSGLQAGAARAQAEVQGLDDQSEDRP